MEKRLTTTTTYRRFVPIRYVECNLIPLLSSPNPKSDLDSKFDYMILNITLNLSYSVILVIIVTLILNVFLSQF